MGIKDPSVRLVVICSVAVVLGYALLLAPSPLWLASVATLIVAVAVPGALLVWLLLGPSDESPAPLEWVVYAAAGGFGVLTVLVLALSYLPGGLAPWQLQSGVGLLSLALALLVLLRRDTVSRASPECFADGKLTRAQWLRIGAAILVVGLVAGYVRFANIGYAEFHGDEARAVLRAAAVIQGDDQVLFLHRKPPGEILLPSVVFAYAGHINEAAARIPFASANMIALLGVLLLGWRMRGQVMGWTAVVFCALDGYLVAFSRFLQYQSLVLLLTVAAVLVFHRIYRHPVALRRYGLAGALFLATAVLYHWDGLLAFLPCAIFVGALLFERRVTWAHLWRAALPAALMAIAILALFFVPLMLQPSAEVTQDYVLKSRLIGAEAILRNNILDIVARTLLYNSVYYLGSLTVLLMVGSLFAWRKGWRRTAPVPIALVMTFALVASLWWPQSLVVNGVDLSFVPTLLLIGGIWVAPGLGTEERALWLWFGVPLIASLFVIATPRTHVHIFLVPAALLAGLTVARLVDWRQRQEHPVRGLAPAALLAAALILLSGAYIDLAFVDSQREMVENWETSKPALYWTPPSTATIDRRYGFPLNNGWKAAGRLYEEGLLQGDFDTLLGADWIPAWYLRGQVRCLSSAESYFAVKGLEPWVESPGAVEDRVEAYGFRPWGSVKVLGRDEMRLYTRNAVDPVNTTRLELTNYENSFDMAADPYLPLAFPVVELRPATATQANYGNVITLEGYDLDAKTPLHPGDTVVLTLHWLGESRMGDSYKVSIQSHDDAGHFAAQADALPLCDRRDTTVWLAGETVVDRHAFVINSDTVPGAYPLYCILYSAKSGERLPLLDAAGQPVDDKFKIAELEVVSP